MGEAPVPLFGKKISSENLGHFQTSIKKAQEFIQEDRKKKVHQNFKDLKTEYKDFKQQIDVEISATPLVIEFPKFTKPIVSVSVGLGHALALSNHYEMYSWGLASYGALGFGYKNNDHQKMPKKLEILDHHSEAMKIIQISCGKYHSMCLSSNHEIFSWGESSLGRLGLGQGIDDILVPQLLQKISYREPFFISAGESHSAAITKDYQLYTWGNGGYGRLGHGFDSNQLFPKHVEALQNEKVTFVSCGSMHTLVTTKNHQVFAFGQTKYGKLGIHYQNLNQELPIDLPTKISMYKMENLSEKADQQEIFQVFASVNHSFALTKKLDLYSWGYSGKGILGRDNKLKSEIGFPVLQLKQSKNSNEEEIQTNLLIKFHESYNDNHQNINHKDELKINMHFQIDQICCNATNTVILSNHGEVFVFGDNTFGQRGCKEINSEYFNCDIYRDYKKYSMPSLIQFKNVSVKIVYVSCGGFHIFAKTNLDEVYGWGRADEGQLGVGILTYKVFEPTIISQISQQGIKQICCGDNFSAALNIFGEVYVTGSLDGGKLGLGKGFRNGFILCFQKIEKQFLPRIEYISCGSSHMLAISKKQNTLQNGDILKADGLTYAWGKNQRGQLGIGNKETQYYPSKILGCKEMLIKVQCGFNFSLGLSQTNKVYFWGNFKYFCSTDCLKDVEEPRVISKLEEFEVCDISCCYKQCYALLKSGKIRQWGRFLYQKKPKSALDQQKKVKKTDQELRQNLMFINIFPNIQKFQVEFQNIYTSQNHTIGITQNRRLYSWGLNNLQNRLGLSKKQDEEKAKNNNNEPIEDEIMRTVFSIQQQNIEKIYFNQEQKTDSSEEEDSNQEEIQVHQEEEKQTNILGLKNESEENNSNQEIENPQDIEIELDESKKDTQIRQSRKNKTSKKPQKTLELESQSEFQGHDITFCLQSTIDKYNNEKKSKMKEEFKISKSKRSEYKKNKEELEGISKKTDEQKEELIDQIQLFKTESLEFQRLNRLLTKQAIQQLIIFQDCFQLKVLELIRHQFHKKKKPVLLKSIEKQNNSVVYQNKQLQKILKKEEKNQFDEKSIIKIDQALIQRQRDLLKKVYTFSKYQVLNKELLLKVQRSFLGRVTDDKFKVKRENELKLKFLGIDEGFLEQKSNIQKILTYLQLHPCYVIKILKTKLFSFDDCKLLIQQLFNSQNSNQKNRLNFLLVTIFKEMLVFELDHFEKFEIANTQVNSSDSKPPIQFGKECKMISIFIFKYVFKSSQTNIDTILCIMCHMLNYILAQFQGSQPNQQDDSMDIRDEIFKENQEKESKKGKKSNKTVEKTSLQALQKRCENLQGLLNNICKSMKDNAILKENTQFFNFSKRTVDQMEFIKKDIKSIIDDIKLKAKINDQKITINHIAGINPEFIKENYPVFRWSEEINQMLHFLVSKISEPNSKFPNKDQGMINIHQQIFSLLFDEILELLEDDKQSDIMMLPYVTKIKLIPQIDIQLKNTHQKNKRNAIHGLRMLLSYQNLFQDKKDDQHVKDLNKQLNDTFQEFRTPLLDRILKYGKEDSEILSYKHFQFQLIHSLDQEDTYLHISKQLIGKILSLFCKNQNQLSLQKPITNDPLIKIIKQIESSNSKNNFIDILLNPQEGAPDPMFMFRLKTRLFINYDFKDDFTEKLIEEKLQNFCRCLICQVPLTCDLAVQRYDLDIILQRYKPQDVQSLPVKFTELLKEVSINPQKKQKLDLPEHPNMTSFIDACEYEARKSDKGFKAIELLIDFKEKLQVQVDNYQNKKKEEQQKKDELEKMRQDAANGEFGTKVKKVKKDPKREKEQKIKDTDEVIQQLIEQTEQRLNLRIQQKFNSDIINAHLDTYFEPLINAKMEHFQNEIMKKNEQLSQNYEYGHSNKEFFAILQNSKTMVPQMFSLVESNKKKEVSEVIGRSLPKKDPKTIRGFLSSDVESLMKDGTIVNVKLVELKDIMDKCNIILVETNDQKMIEFKMVFRVLKKQLCGPSIVTQEHTVINFMIDPKVLKTKLQKLTLQQKEINKSQDKKKNQQVLVLVFEESDALEFNPVKFQELIMKMESSKSVFAQQALRQQQK